MAEGIVYLDVDDEITSAAQRIRSAAGTRVALVVPYGSRIATSRMNFRLLSREAVLNNRRLSIVSGDAAVRSLAASAGLPVFGSVAEYDSAGPSSGPARDEDAAVGAPVPADAAAAAAGAAGIAPASLAASETVVVPTTADGGAPSRKSQRPKRPIDGAMIGAATGAAAVAGPAATIGPAALPPTRPSDARPGPAVATHALDAGGDDLPPLLGSRIRAPVIVAIGLLALALIVGGVGAYLFLPSATITLTPRRDAIAPFEITVSADPEATAVDPVNGVVPAVRLDVPVEATRTFTTIGTHVEESPARGSVTFTNYDTSSGVSIPAGSIVSTEGGIRFRTQRTVALQPASVFPAFVPTSGSTQVVAVRTGEPGNVPANTIRVVPQGQDPVLLRVNNPAESSGGTRTETPEITQPEVDKAVAAVQADLVKTFADAVSAGADAPGGTTLFPETATPGAAIPDVDPKTFVGQAVGSFELRMTATGTVVAVDPTPVRSIARAQLDAKVSADHRLLEDSVAIVVGPGTVGEDGQVTFQATVRATEVRIVDAATLPELVKGRTKVEAEAALAPLGTATVTLWPDWARTVTTVDARLSVTVDDVAAGGPGPDASPGSGGPRPSATPRRSGAPASIRPASVPPSAAP